MPDCDYCRYAWSTPGSMGSCPDRMELPDGGCAVEDDLPEEGYDGEGPCPCFRPHVWTEEELCEPWWEEEMERIEEEEMREMETEREMERMTMEKDIEKRREVRARMDRMLMEIVCCAWADSAKHRADAAGWTDAVWVNGHSERLDDLVEEVRTDGAADICSWTGRAVLCRVGSNGHGTYVLGAWDCATGERAEVGPVEALDIVYDDWCPEAVGNDEYKDGDEDGGDDE